MNFFKFYSPLKENKKSFDINKSFSKKEIKPEPIELDWLKYINKDIKFKLKNENSSIISYTANIKDILSLTKSKNSQKVNIENIPFRHYSLSIYSQTEYIISKIAFEGSIFKKTFSNKSRIEINGEVYLNPNLKKTNDNESNTNKSHKLNKSHKEMGKINKNKKYNRNSKGEAQINTINLINTDKDCKNDIKSKNNHYFDKSQQEEESFSEDDEENGKSKFIVNQKGVFGKIRVKHISILNNENYFNNVIKINEKGNIRVDCINECHLNNIVSIIPKGIYLISIYKTYIELFNSNYKRHKKNDGKENYIGIRLNEKICYFDSIVLLFKVNFLNLKNINMNIFNNPEDLYVYMHKTYKFSNSYKFESSLLLHSSLKRNFNSLIGFKFLYNMNNYEKSNQIEKNEENERGKLKKDKEKYKNSIEFAINNQMKSILLSFTSSISDFNLDLLNIGAENIDYGFHLELKNSKRKRFGVMINIL